MDIFNIKEVLIKYTKSKKALTILLAFIIGFLFILIPLGPADKTEKTSEPDQKSTVNNQEDRLETILTSVDGIKKVRVMICFNDSGIKEYYRNESEDRDSENIRTDKKIVITKTDGDEMPVLKREISPDIKGVSIVADCRKKGMEDIIYKLSSKALGVDIHKIEVVINDRS